MKKYEEMERPLSIKRLPTLCCSRAKIESNKGNYSKAIAILESAFNDDFADPWIVYRLSETYLEYGYPLKALRYLDLLRINGINTDSVKSLEARIMEQRETLEVVPA